MGKVTPGRDEASYVFPSGLNHNLIGFLLSRWLAQNFEALRIDEDYLPTPKATTGPLQPDLDVPNMSKPSTKKATGGVFDLPPPDSDEWQAAPPSPRKKR